MEVEKSPLALLQPELVLLALGDVGAIPAPPYIMINSNNLCTAFVHELGCHAWLIP